MEVDIYDWDTIQNLPKEDETFFSKYAQGDWSSFQLTELPPELEAEMMSDISSQTTDSNNNGPEDVVMSKSEPPPDLTQSMTNIYQSFLLDLGHSSQATSFSTPSPGIPDQGSITAGMHVKPMPINCQYSYAAHHSRRYRKLGYLEPPMPVNELQRRKALQVYVPYICMYRRIHALLVDSSLFIPKWIQISIG